MIYTVNHVRQLFLDFFVKHGHTLVESAPLVPHNDPTLMFTNAGMVPFKNVFTGVESRNFKKAVSSQKCVRAGGKHNDLDNVGYTARHHTFFEMLGNFSFGDYFKEEAISLAWEFLTDILNIPADKLYVTIYHTDDEAYNIWKNNVGLSEDRIIRIASNDNFWAMGDTGPCGPCSEIFYDHGPEIEGGLPGTEQENGDRYIEIWNLVFMQYNQDAEGNRNPLPNPCIDTGMGLERIAAVLQNVHDNYDIDLFNQLIDASRELTGDKSEEHITSHRVIADHLRSSCFLIADGVMPSNEGRGYVLRRIMRRAMRHVHQIGYNDSLMYKLVPALIEQMGQAFPELGRAEAFITETLKSEEERFRETLDRGLKLLESETANLQAGNELGGEIAFKLYDTYGFPLDLTKDILRSRNITVDKAGFETCMNEQKARAKAAWKGSGEQTTDELWFTIKEDTQATEFLGYKVGEAQGQVIAIIAGGALVDQAKQGDEVSIILNQTPFYGESGGQQGDRGSISNSDKQLNITVNNTEKKLDSLFIHQGKITSGEVAIGDIVHASIDTVRRNQLRCNHSATHLLHAVLREVIGPHVTQKGSLVAPDRLRFDFSHTKGLTEEEVATIEAKVNQLIRQNTPVGTRLMTPDEATKSGALALFGEKYGEEVRVVNMGLAEEVDYSVELCGGTHVSRTGDIGLFKIISEGAIAAGIRRIEALTGNGAYAYVLKQEQQLQTLAQLVKVPSDELSNRIEQLLSERKALDKEISQLRKQAALGGGDSSVEKEDVNGVSFLGKHFTDIPPKDLRGMIEEMRQSLGSGVVVITCVNEGKVSLLAAVSDDLCEKYSAVDLVRAAAAKVGGQGGGGKPTLAQAGGSDGGAVDEALEAAKALLT